MYVYIEKSGFSYDSKLAVPDKSAVPDSYFWAATSAFQENLTKLHTGTPTCFLKKCPWNPCFENLSENSGNKECFS